MSDVIKRVEVQEPDLFLPTRESAEKTLKSLDALGAGLEKIATISNKIIGGAKPTDASSLKAFEKAINDANTAYKKQIDLEKQQQVELKKLEKARLDQIRIEKEREKNVDAFNKRLEKQIQNEEKLQSLYNKAQVKLNGLTNEYRDLAIKKELTNKLSGDEEKRYNFLQQKITRYDQALKTVDATMGKHQRNVGNYAGAYNGLQNSINQLSREMPAFANSIQTGFMAISNNLPMFFDEIKKIRVANQQLVKDGQPVQSVFKQLGAGIFSVGTALSVGVTLLTVYGKEIVNFAKELFIGRQSIDKNAVALEAYSSTLETYKSTATESTAKVKEMAENFKLAEQGVISKDDALKIYNDTLGSSLGYAKDYNEAEKIFIEKSEAFIQAFSLRAQAQALYTKAGEEAAKALTAGMEDNISMSDKFYKGLNAALSGTAPSLKELRALQKKGTEEAVKDAKTREKIFTTEADNLYRQAQELAKKYDLEFEGGKQDKEKIKKTKELKTELDDLNLTLKEERDILQEMINLSNKLIDVEDFEGQRAAVLQKLEFDKETLDIALRDEFDAKKKALEENRAELLKQENLTQAARDQINEDYFRKLNELNDFEIEQIRITELEKQLLILKSEEEIIAIKNKINEIKLDQELKSREKEFEMIDQEEKEKRLLLLKSGKSQKEIDQIIINDHIEALKEKIALSELYGKDTVDLEIELAELLRKKESDIAKKRFEEQKKWADLTAEYFTKQSEKRIAQLDKEITASEKQQEILQQLAINGNIAAEQSLAVQKQITDKANAAKIKEQKRIEKIKLANTAFDVYGKKVEAGEKNPLLSTIKDVELLRQFINSLPAFEKGTMDAPEGYALTQEKGREIITDKDGKIKSLGSDNGPQLTYLNKGDKVFNNDLTELAHKAKYAQSLKQPAAIQQGGQWQGQNELLKKVDKMTSAIENMPGIDIRMGEIFGGFAKVIETKTQKGKTEKTTFNYRTRGQ